MKYVFFYLVPVYYNLLKSAITIGGAYLPVYDAEVPPTETGSYILIGERNTNQEDAKGTFLFDARVLIDVVIKGQSFSFKDCEDATSQIVGLIHSDANPDCTPNFQVVTTDVTFNSLNSISSTDLIYRTLIRFHHKIKSLT